MGTEDTEDIVATITITCWKCSLGYEIACGADVRAVRCPRCQNPPTNYFKTLENPAYDRACGHARLGEKEAALLALEEALRSGVDLELVDSDPALGKLRSDPRFLALVKKFRPK